MKAPRIIYMQGNFRIIEIPDEVSTLDNLVGDFYNPKVNPSINAEQLKSEFEFFKQSVELNGVFGYVLEKWNPEVGQGWEHIDSCFGFVGQFEPDQDEFNHYIVEELKQQIKL
ncbi:MAG: hypothetical protein ACRCST_00605 [Turicibacter sp.]